MQRPPHNILYVVGQSVVANPLVILTAIVYTDKGTFFTSMELEEVPYRGLAEAGVKVHFYHRTLEEYLAASISAGFQLQQLVDVPTPEGSFKRRNDTLIPEGYHFPFFTILSLVKV